jgi:hypothetical protein
LPRKQCVPHNIIFQKKKRYINVQEKYGKNAHQDENSECGRGSLRMWMLFSFLCLLYVPGYYHSAGLTFVDREMI